jgi:N-acyl-L-homoserine lactone synthetase
MTAPPIPRNIAHAEVAPSLDSRVFEMHPNVRFAIGIVAVNGQVLPGFENEYTAYTELRGNVYEGQKHWMSPDELNSDGTETDADDGRSVEFVALENGLYAPRMIGGKRLIVKSKDSSEPLPIEHHYPEVFQSSPAPLNSAESSRLISRHEDPRVQKMIKWALFKSAVSYLVAEQISPVYGVVEPSLARGLKVEGMPLTELAPAKFVPEINARKQPIVIDIAELALRLESQQLDASNGAEDTSNGFVYSGHFIVPGDHRLTA